MRGGRLKIVALEVHRQPLRPDRPGPRRRRRARAVAVPRPAGDVVRSTFTRGVCSNGAALSSIGVSWSIYNSVFTAQPRHRPRRQPRAPGHARRRLGRRRVRGRQRLPRPDRRHEDDGNHAREGGGAVFFVSNDRSGVLEIRSSTLRKNPSDGFETDPGIYFLGREQIVAHSVVR